MMQAPIPSVALSDALLFADPTASVLTDLASTSDRWMEAAVLGTPFWAPGTGKLNGPIDIDARIPSLITASVRFDPDRELRVASLVPKPNHDPSTSWVLARCRRLRVQLSLPAASLPSLLLMTPNLTALHITCDKQLIDNMEAVASLKSLRAFSVGLCSTWEDLVAFSLLPWLHTLSLVGCWNLRDIRALASLTELRVLKLSGCSRLTNTRPLGSLVSLNVLGLTGCEILSDITRLASLTSLRELVLTGCDALEDISPLGSLTNLQKVDICTPQVSDISVMASLTSLCELRLAGRFGMKGFSALQSMPLLHTVNLIDFDCVGIDLTTLTHLKSLRTVRFSFAEDSASSLAEFLRKRTRGAFVDNVAVDDHLLLPATRMQNHNERDVAENGGPEVELRRFDASQWSATRLLKSIRSEQMGDKLEGTRVVREIISDSSSEFLDQINGEAFPPIVDQLLCDELPELQLESIKVLRMICKYRSDDVSLAVPHIVPNLVHLLQSPDEDCRREAAQGVGDLVSEASNFRDRCLECGAFEILMDLIIATSQSGQTAAGDFVRALLMLVGTGAPLPPERIAPALPVAIEMLNSEDDAASNEGVRIISNLSLDERLIPQIVDAGCWDRLLELLNSTESDTVVRAFKTILNIARSNEDKALSMYNEDILQAIHRMLSHPSLFVRKEVSGFLAFVSSRNHPFDALVDAGIFPALMNATGRAADSLATIHLLMHGIFVICNAVFSCILNKQRENTAYFLRIGVLAYLCEIISNRNTGSKLLTIALNGIRVILIADATEKDDSGGSLFADEILNFGGLEALDSLLNHIDGELHEVVEATLSFFDSEAFEW